MKVLIVDSDVFFRETHCSYLKNKLLDVSCADCVDELVEWCECDAWDIIVVSTQSAGGFYFAKSCATNFPHASVIMVSARYSLQEKFKSYEVGVDMYLVKPLSPVDLHYAVTLLANKKKASAAPVDYNATLNLTDRVILFNRHFVRLTENECLLLHALSLADSGKLQSWQLMERLGIIDCDNGAKYLGIIVSRLRSKLKDKGFSADALKAIRGYGYQLSLKIALV